MKKVTQFLVEHRNTIEIGLAALLSLTMSACVSCSGEDQVATSSGRVAASSARAAVVGGPSPAAVRVTTQHNDVSRSGLNPAETILTASGPDAISTANFGELWRLPVDGQINAQPLYVGNYLVSGQTTPKNVLIVATLRNTVYAFDADSGSPTPLWTWSGDPPFAGGITNNKPTGHNAAFNGIMSTPVIDPGRPVPGKAQPGVIYVVAMFAPGANGKEDFKIYQISLFDGKTVKNASGNDVATDLGACCADLIANDFDVTGQLNRPGLLLSSGYVYVAFGSRFENFGRRFHGWVLRFDAGTLQMPASGGFYRTTDNITGGGGIWQAGTGLAADSAGAIYFVTGNGDYNWGGCCVSNTGVNYFDHPDACDRPIDMFLSDGSARCHDQTSFLPGNKPHQDEDSIVRLSANLGKLGSYAPWGLTNPAGVFGRNFQSMEACDADFGSSGPLLFTQGGLTRLVAGGKAGEMFVLDPAQIVDAKGHDGESPMTQPSFQGTWNYGRPRDGTVFDARCYDKWFTFGPHIHGSPAFFHGTTSDGTAQDYVFVWGERDYPRRFAVAAGTVDASGVTMARQVYGSRYTDRYPMDGMPGGAVSISSNGADMASAILWALIPSKGACGANQHCDVSRGEGAPAGIVTGELVAFRASDLALLWGTRNFHSTLALDLSGGPGMSRLLRDYTKFVPPTIANGKVFVATSAFSVAVYGKRTLRTANLTSSFSTPCTGNRYTGDVDGDGVADLICHHQTEGTLGSVDIAFGRVGSTSFPAATTSQSIQWCYRSANTPEPQLYVGDFDGDGRADLLCHDVSNGKDFLAYSQGGSSPYGVAGATSINNNPWCMHTSHSHAHELVIGDYDGDGRSDLLCHDLLGTESLDIRIARSDGTFATSVFSSTTPAPPPWCFDRGEAGTSNLLWQDSLLAADIDGDGLDDLLCHRPSDGFKWVSFNKLDRFHPSSDQPPPPVFTGTDWSYPLAWCADFDAEGHELDQLRLADLDGDGAADMLCHNRSNGVGTSSVRYSHRGVRGTSSGCGPGQPFACTADWTRAAADHWCTGSDASALPSVLAADVDGDNRADLICHNGSSNQIGYYPIAGMTDLVRLRRGEIVDAFYLGQNGAGQPNGLRIHTLVPLGDGSQFTFVNQDIDPNYGAQDMANWKVAGDLNFDGLPDLVDAFYLGQNGPGALNGLRIHTALSTGPGTWSFTYQDIDPSYGAADMDHWKVIGDLNGDGRPDLVGPFYLGQHGPGGINGLRIHTALSTGPGTWSFTYQDIDPNYGAQDMAHWKVIGDLNGDGRPDLVDPFYLGQHGPGGVNGLRMHTALSTGPGTWSFTYQNIDPNYGFDDMANWKVTSDLNGDGRPDLVDTFYLGQNGSGTPSGLRIHVALSTAPGTWSFQFRDVAPSYDRNDAASWKVADIDGDGRSDLVNAAVVNGALRIYSARSTGPNSWSFTFQDVAATYSASDAATWKVMDVNGDGLADLVNTVYLGQNGPGQPSGLRVHTAVSRGDGTWVFGTQDVNPAYSASDMENWKVGGLINGLTQ